tara:strand:+ start:2090 stop:2200 length:111 start_codon:yes stop_codon:yes gene_type:complete
MGKKKANVSLITIEHGFCAFGKAGLIDRPLLGRYYL